MSKTPKVSLVDLAERDRPTSLTAPQEPTTNPPPARKPTKGRVARTGTMAQIGLYVHEVTQEQARAAYVSDYHLRGQQAPNGYDRWIVEAVRELAALTPRARQKRLDALPPEPETVTDATTGEQRPAKRKGNKIRMPEDVAARMDVARDEDEREGVAARGRNAFIVAAMRYGTERARRLAEQRTGRAELPTPPSRLPRRGSSRI